MVDQSISFTKRAVLGSTTVSTPKIDTTRPTLPADWGQADKQPLQSTTTESAIIATTELLEDLLILTTQSGKLGCKSPKWPSSSSVQNV